MKKLQISKTILAIVLICITFSACKKDTVAVVPPTLIKSWMINLSARFEIPAPIGRAETGMAMLDLYSDSTLVYNITVTGLASNDVVNAAHIHVGNAISNGAVIVDFRPTFTSGSARGTVNVRKSFSDSLINATADFYVNVHSTQVASGIIRGQFENPVTFATDVALSGANEVPAVITTATGLALIRLTTNKTLFARITINALEATDALTAAHIHTGAAGTNGGVIVPLASSAADFVLPFLRIPSISDANIALIQTGLVYVNVHSTVRPGGVVRGQIR